MNAYYIDFWLKNDVVIQTYFDTNSDNITLLAKLVNTTQSYIITNLRENGHIIAINKDEIACIEIVGEEVNNA